MGVAVMGVCVCVWLLWVCGGGAMMGVVIYNVCDGMNIVHVMSFIVKVIIKCGYHVLYYPNDGVHMTPDILHCRCDVFKREGVMTYGVEEMSGLTCFKSDIELGSSSTQYG